MCAYFVMQIMVTWFVCGLFWCGFVARCRFNGIDVWVGVCL